MKNFSNSSEENEPLYGFSNNNGKKVYGSIGSLDGSSKSGESRSTNREDRSNETPLKIPLFKLFRYATFRDKIILFIGIIFTIIHGIGFPILAINFGSMTNILIKQSLYGFQNSTHTNSTTTTTTIYYNDTYTDTIKINETENFSKIETWPNGNNRSSWNEAFTEQVFTDLLTQYALNFLFIGVIVLISSLIQAVTWEWACERQVYRLRQEFFYQVLRQEVAWYDHHQTGELSLRLSDDLERVREGIGHKFSMIIQHAATFFSGFAIGFYTNWQLTLVILSLTPLLAATSAFTGRMIATQSVREQKKYGKAGGIAQEVISCIRTVASFSKEDWEIRRYEEALRAGMRNAMQKYHYFSVGIGLVFLVMYSSYALAFWYSCELLGQDKITPGEVFTIFFGVLMGAYSIGNAVPYLSIVAVAQGSGAIVYEVIDSTPRTIDAYSKEGLMPTCLKGRIIFSNLSFRYPSRREIMVLNNFSMEIEPGQTIALVGESGSGKSTVGDLLLRFYDPDSGEITIDGIDIKDLNLAWLRHNIGIVSQEPVLFGTSIYENIQFGREDVMPVEIVTAAKMANAYDFISSLPMGFDTIVGEKGAQLSGGQKQRIAIARALVRDPSLLILDESTSALDIKSESIVQQALDRVSQGRTTIIIAHRLSTIKNADLIFTLKDGRIVEKGTHTELMDLMGHYHSLVMTQISQDFGQNDETASASIDSDSSMNNYEYQRKIRRKRNPNHKIKVKSKRIQLPDPDKRKLAVEVKELNLKYPSFWRILKMNRSEWWQLVMGSIGCLICGATMPIFAFFYAEMFSTFGKTGEELEKSSFFWSMMFVVLALVSGFGYWLRTIFIASAGEHLTMRLRLYSYLGIIRQEIEWFDEEKNSASRLSTRLARDVPLVKAAAGHRVAVVLTSCVTLFAGLGISFYCGWQLALVLSIGFPILIVAGYIQIHVQKGGQKKDAALMEDAGRTSNECISNIRTVQAYSLERGFFERYLDLLFPVYVEAHKQALIYGLAFAFSEAVIFLIYAGAFRYGAYLIIEGIMDSPSVYRVFFSISFCAISVGQSTSFIPDYAKANLASALIFNLIDLKSKIDPLSKSGIEPPIEGRITFKDVLFRYSNRAEAPVLQGLSFDLQPGVTLALIGPSGSGKSTVASLIERFYDVTSGYVMIDGIDIRAFKLSHLRKHIGYVTQEPVLFDATIKENIAYGYCGPGHVSFDLIIEAAKNANIHNFIQGLPMGYETRVGEGAIQISVGQKQRIAIARALIRNPKILILDEATSALDSESEKIVQEAIEKARSGRTCIIIAHRLSSIKDADFIAVLGNNGRIIEMGKHEELLNRKGIYYKLTRK